MASKKSSNPSLEETALNEWAPDTEVAEANGLPVAEGSMSTDIALDASGELSEEKTLTWVSDPSGLASHAELKQLRDDEATEELKEELAEEFTDNDDAFSVADLLSEEEELAALGTDPELADSDELDAALNRIAAATEAETAKRVAELQALAKEAQAEMDAENAAQIEAEVAEQAALDAQSAQDDAELAPPAVALTVDEAVAAIEAVLFVSEKSQSRKKLREILGEETSEEILDEALVRLAERYSPHGFGIELVEVAGGYLFRTKVSQATFIRKLARVQTQRLSRGAMETLAMIAYKQPCLKEDVDAIRGVDSSHFIRTLLDRKLIHMAGRSELPGRPILYATTSEFLELFGLNEVSDLPPLRELEQMVPNSETPVTTEDNPAVRTVRKLVNQMNLDEGASGYNAKEDEVFLQEIREQVKAIPITTPTLEARRAAEEAAEEEVEAAAAKNTAEVAAPTQSGLFTAPLAEPVSETSLG